uniref:Uncharacterized protein n=1 Tax=Triticum urartu TaxID=4572 RepID=A0A8R7TE20_TRIUA
MNLHFPGLDKGKGLYFLFVKSESKTPGGLTAWPMMTSIYKSEQFKGPLRDHTSPRAARDPGRPARHLRGAHGLRHLLRRVHQPVQGAPLRRSPARH